MNTLINKLVILVFSTVAAMILLPIKILIFPLLIIVTLGSLQEYSDRSPVKVGIFIGYCLICLFIPECIYLLPVLTYDLFFASIQPGILACLPAVIYGTSKLSTAVLLIDLAILAAVVLLKGAELRSKNSQQKFLSQRDLLAEKSINLERKLANLIVNQDEEVELATLQERTRIAREIHDNVGHMLTSSILQVGALMATTKDPATKAGLATVKDTLDQSMNSIRSSVHNLRDTAVDLYGQLKKLTDDFSVSQGENKCIATLNYDISASLILSIGAKYAIISIVKEALSNTAKHSGATEVTVGLHEHQKLLQLIISDNGRGIPREKLLTLADSEGMGIEGIKQRVASFSGHINITCEKGFKIFISFPKEELQ